jgi:iron complex outermembrane receptor protein
MEIANVRFNAAAFHYKGKDLQVQITDQNSGITSVKNAASSKTDGFEGDLSWAVVRGLELDAGLGYQNAKFDDFPGGQIITPAVVGTVTTIANLSGRWLPQAPRWSGYVRPVVTQPLPNNLGVLDANVVVNYTGQFYWTPDNVVREPGKMLINANVGWKSADGHYAVSIFGTNLADRQYSTHAAQFSTGGWRDPGPPRMYGVRGAVNF